MKAFIFPGQGSQFEGMGKDLYASHPKAANIFRNADKILGFNISETMFNGSAEDLKQTRVTQPAIFIHSVALSIINTTIRPDAVAGHSLGEFSALVSNEALGFEDALHLVYKRATAMQRACETNPSGMAAILGLEDHIVEEVCASIIGEIVVAANYNCPGQLVISGSLKGVEIACEKLKSAGAKRAMVLPVSGGFHSPFMEPAREELAEAIDKTSFHEPACPIYQNVDAQPTQNVSDIKRKLIAQLTSPVRWTQSVQQMAQDGISEFVECGPGKVLQGLIKKISPEALVSGVTV